MRAQVPLNRGNRNIAEFMLVLFSEMYAKNPGWLKASQKTWLLPWRCGRGTRLYLMGGSCLGSTMGAAPLAKGCSCPTAAALGLFLAGSSCPKPRCSQKWGWWQWKNRVQTSSRSPQCCSTGFSRLLQR